jgi:hypothetical protein
VEPDCGNQPGSACIRFRERRAPSPKSDKFFAHTLGSSWCLQWAQMYSTVQLRRVGWQIRNSRCCVALSTSIPFPRAPQTRRAFRLRRHRWKWPAVRPTRGGLHGSSQPFLQPVFLLLACCTQKDAKPAALSRRSSGGHYARAIALRSSLSKRRSKSKVALSRADRSSTSGDRRWRCGRPRP